MKQYGRKKRAAEEERSADAPEKTEDTEKAAGPAEEQGREQEAVPAEEQPERAAADEAEEAPSSAERRRGKTKTKRTRAATPSEPKKTPRPKRRKRESSGVHKIALNASPQKDASGEEDGGEERQGKRGKRKRQQLQERAAAEGDAPMSPEEQEPEAPVAAAVAGSEEAPRRESYEKYVAEQRRLYGEVDAFELSVDEAPVEQPPVAPSPATALGDRLALASLNTPAPPRPAVAASKPKQSPAAAAGAGLEEDDDGFEEDMGVEVQRELDEELAYVTPRTRPGRRSGVPTPDTGSTTPLGAAGGQRQGSGSATPLENQRGVKYSRKVVEEYERYKTSIGKGFSPMSIKEFASRQLDGVLH